MKNEKNKSEILTFEAVRPFGPTIVKGKLPKSLVDLMDNKSTEMLEDKKLAKEFDHSGSLAGNVKQEVRFPQKWMNTEEFLPMVNLCYHHFL